MKKRNLSWDGLETGPVRGTSAHPLGSFIRRRMISVNKSQNTVCLTFAIIIAYVLKPGNPVCLWNALAGIYWLSLAQMIALMVFQFSIFNLRVLQLFCSSKSGLGSWLILIVRSFQTKSCGEPNSSKLSDQETRVQSFIWPQVTAVTVADELNFCLMASPTVRTA